MTIPIYSLSISARLTLDMHSLNNEGSEGNQIQTRMVNIVAADGRLYNVNAISGDMFKHIQAEHLFHLAKEDEHLPLCTACEKFDANRISADPKYLDEIQGRSDGDAIDLMLQRCTLDDIEGNLITAAGRSTPRKSVAEFGWVVGIPVDEDGRELTTTGSYLHTKYASERGEEARDATRTEESRQDNLKQVLFHRPASSGVYAFVSHYEIARVGYNDITRTYALPDDARLRRYRVLLESVLYTFLQPKGAMRSAQLPHLVNIQGVVSYTTGVLPAPTVSPLNPDFSAEIKQITATLNGLHSGKVLERSFDSLVSLVDIIRELIETTGPFRLPT